jgi:hypothetical protein
MPATIGEQEFERRKPPFDAPQLSEHGLEAVALLGVAELPRVRDWIAEERQNVDCRKRQFTLHCHTPASRIGLCSSAMRWQTALHHAQLGEGVMAVFPIAGVDLRHFDEKSFCLAPPPRFSQTRVATVH